MIGQIPSLGVPLSDWFDELNCCQNSSSEQHYCDGIRTRIDWCNAVVLLRFFTVVRNAGHLLRE